MPESDQLEVLLLAGPLEARGRCAYTLRLAQHLPELGIAPTLISPDIDLLDLETRRRLNAVEYRRIDTPLWGRYVRWCLLEELRKRPPALIHIQTRRALRLGTWLARHLKVPFLLTIHDQLAPNACVSVDRRWCRRIITASPSVQGELTSRLRFPAELVTHIAAGVEVEATLDCPTPLDPGHVPVIGTATPLEAQKGVPYFLGAARRALEVRSQLEFLVAGAGPEEANLRRIARELGITDKVTFVPYARDFGDSLAAMDIFCLPSLQQGLGTIMLEAMALGRPVIATEVGGVSSIIREGETGLSVPPRDSATLAARILELLDNPTRARAIGTAARRLVAEQFNVRRMVEQTAEIYREVCTCPLRLSPSAQN